MDADAVQETVACWLPPTALTAVGESGTVAGVTDADAVELVDVSVPLKALTTNVYA